MSICRWSSDNMKSDVYVYEAEDNGFVINIAEIHPINTEILGPDVHHLVKDLLQKETPDREAFQAALDNRHKLVSQLEYVPVDSEYAGKTLHAESLEELYSVLLGLILVGIHVPQVALSNILEEIDDNERSV